MRFCGSRLCLAVSAFGMGLASLPAAAASVEERLEILTQEVEQLKARQHSAAPGTAETTHAHGRAPQAAERRGVGQTFVGSYGEMHYNNLESKQELDFHRFILFLGHNFSDRVRLFSELELEHSLAGEGKKGEVELEQAYLEFDLNSDHAAKAGLFLIPVGIINETHEPPTFYGVERNPVESNIIPTTWWEGGMGVSGKLSAGLRYDLALTSGLKVNPSPAGKPQDAYLIRGGRQKVSEANADDGALTTRLRWTGIPGVELAATFMYQDDLAQANGGAAAASATLIETHAAISKGPFGLRALYAQWDLDGAGPATGASPGRDKQLGWYLEPSFKLSQKLGAFARYAEWDNNAGSARTVNAKKDQTNVGVNFWPQENVVLKFDVQQQGNNGSDDGFNLGVGYMF